MDPFQLNVNDFGPGLAGLGLGDLMLDWVLDLDLVLDLALVFAQLP